MNALCAGALVALAAGLAAPAGLAQEAEPSLTVPGLRPGPTREARAVTARQLAQPSEIPVPILPRYFAFESDFATDFGLGPSGEPLGDADFMRQVRQWLAIRWGDTSVYQWVERALVMYAQVQASTRFEKNGFDMGVDMDDVTRGKVGLRVSRSLE